MDPAFAPSFPTPDDDRLDAQTVLEAAGVRRTRQRLAVFEQLRRAAPHHPTAEELYRAARAEVPNLSLATVYKALDALDDAGLVVKLNNADGTARYDARDDRHYHLRCLKTGDVKDLPVRFDDDLLGRIDPGLVEALRAEGFRVTGYRLEVVGYYVDPSDSDAEATDR